MKKYILSIALCAAAFSLYAQDPALTNPQVTPTPAEVSKPITSSVDISNATAVPVPVDPLDPMTITFTFSKVKISFAAGLPVIGGPGAAYFSWEAFCTGTCALDGSSDSTDQWIVLGTNILDLPANLAPSTITISGTTTAEGMPQTPTHSEGVGFQANLIPAPYENADINQENVSNSQALFVQGLPLPVTLISFKAAKEGATANLAWSTTMETNSDHFEIQRSSNAKNWEKIGSVASHGESKDLKTYSFADATPRKGHNYYRLRMVDTDNTFAYSSIQNLKFEGELVSVFPNPVADKVYLNTDLSQVKSAALINASGNTVINTSSVKDGIAVNQLHAGLYTMKVTHTDGSMSTHKVVVVR